MKDPILPNFRIIRLENPTFTLNLTLPFWIKMDLKINKEDYEKERLRWQQKLDETERRLAEAEIFNSEMNQIKAELNKKIVEMERNQKPLIEQNRRLNERAKLLQNEIKKSEQKLSHSQDDFLTLKDAHEKLLKENTILKERRAFPEKMEELDRYRTQVLEYSKCITALRQAGLVLYLSLKLFYFF
ncbi:unnamed protein product [Dracunculus medinensis]|uniref:Uncharacterized protein n=1 Tax=Dracunculus medinensis TaxID=318479 RepID=A0A0N4U8D2_DRAME|nr:unnamed protein product [Dracunculus medinensis]